MLLLRCSLDADSMSRSTSFCPSTMATLSSSCWVALNSMRFTCCSPARAGERYQPAKNLLMDDLLGSLEHFFGKLPLRALLVVSLLPVSEINQRFRPGCGRTGGGLQVPAPGKNRESSSASCASQLKATGRSYGK